MEAEQSRENIEKSISEKIREALEALTRNQRRFVIALDEYGSKQEAAEAIGINPNTVYKWNGAVDRALELIRHDREEAALQMRKQALIKAMAVKIAALDSDDEGIRQKAATEIIEWQLGRAIQKQELSGADGGPLEIHVVYDEIDNGTPTQTAS